MTKRIVYQLALECPKCGRSGTAEASEHEGLNSTNVEFRIDHLPDGFRVARPARSLGATDIVCVSCDVAAR